ncbi:lysophospholipid acyltransferase family protein [Planctomicrobium piriforme]|uniref:1-acyl-sn-glycerol-3-phosphate acyltransferase n=1 Tax=Planctomicrobium piriforme TaxID=1576369 RepID=A0A1I3QT45_9PLAN|nr:lysophospholipid acyltransferase family protein [Planctomicrobium piriforme]SFJ37344.1 1-acyl-sn-glycerol-3-phosphate acyltransferase [Planctomicrobium piriforme]
MNRASTPVDPRSRNWVWYGFQLLLQNLFVFCFRYRVAGLEKLPDGGALLLINHQSFVDPLVAAVAMQRPVSYLARHNLFQIPILGWILRHTYVMPIRRGSAGTESIRLAVERLQQGYYVGLFPEGTRSRDGKLQEIKPGFMAIVKRAKVPVIPVGVAGAIRAFPRGAMIVRPYTVRVVIGDPISVEEAEQLTQRGREQEFLDRVRTGIQTCLTEAENWLD